MTETAISITSRPWLRAGRTGSVGFPLMDSVGVAMAPVVADGSPIEVGETAASVGSGLEMVGVGGD